MTKRTLPALLLVAAVGVTGPAVAGAGAGGRGDKPSAAELAKVRKATERFRDVDAAVAAGYVATPACDRDPARGGMGIHYMHPANVADGKLIATKPEFLLYEPTASGGRRLIAVEYYDPDDDQSKATSDTLPRVLGRPLDPPMDGHVPGMPIHRDLHVWLYKRNPKGLFSPFNPRVTC